MSRRLTPQALEQLELLESIAHFNGVVDRWLARRPTPDDVRRTRAAARPDSLREPRGEGQSR